MLIQARMAHHGDMTLDATFSNFTMGEIVAYNSLDPEKTVVARMTEQGPANTLTLFNIAWNDDFTFKLTGLDSGTFALSIVCESDAVCVRTMHSLTSFDTAHSTADHEPNSGTNGQPDLGSHHRSYG